MRSSSPLDALVAASDELRDASRKWDTALVEAMVAGATIAELASACGRSRSATHRALIAARRRVLRRGYREDNEGE